MKRHYNDTDLFNAMLRLARKSGKFSRCEAILDYANAREQRIVLTDYQFDTHCIPAFGGSEGIYVDVCICGKYNDIENADRIVQIGTLKTLGEGLEDMMIMGEACGVLTYYAYDFVNSNIDAFSPEGADIPEEPASGTGILHGRYMVAKHPDSGDAESEDV